MTIENGPHINRQMFTSAYFDTIKARRGEVSFPKEHLLKDNQPPSIDAQHMVLFFKPPEATPRTTIDLPAREEEFLHKMTLYPWPGEIFGGNLHNELTLQDKSKGNVKNSIRALIDGFKSKKPRRTGEKDHIHSLRVFVRGNAEQDYVHQSKRDSHYVSLLARILHDAKEDLHDFKITKASEYETPSSLTKYEVTFAESSTPYSLFLTDKEHRLLELQLNAVTIPSEVEAMPNGPEKTEAQIQHLLTITRQIAEDSDFGAFEAYQTLRIKLDDRIDNVLTYYKANSSKGKEDFRDKLHETIHYFIEVETEAKQYFQTYQNEIRDVFKKEVPTPTSETMESVVWFCYYLLEGGTFQDFLSETIESERKNFDEHPPGMFLLPSLNSFALSRRLAPSNQ